MSYELQIRKKDGTLHSKHLITDTEFLLALAKAREIFHEKVAPGSGLTLRFNVVEASEPSGEFVATFQPRLFTEAQ